MLYRRCSNLSVGIFCVHVLVATQIVKVTGVPTTGMTMTVLMRGSNRLVLDEAERSVHDALCVVRSLVSAICAIFF